MRITWQQQQLRSTRGGANNQWIAQRESLSLQHCLFGLLKRTLGHKPLNHDVLAPAPPRGRTHTTAHPQHPQRIAAPERRNRNRALDPGKSRLRAAANEVRGIEASKQAQASVCRMTKEETSPPPSFGV